MIGSGLGTRLMTQRLVMTSLRSVMWSLCRWVSSTAVSMGGTTPPAASRRPTPRPASNRNVVPTGSHQGGRAGPVRRRAAGCPVPSSVISMVMG